MVCFYSSRYGSVDIGWLGWRWICCYARKLCLLLSWSWRGPGCIVWKLGHSATGHNSRMGALQFEIRNAHICWGLFKHTGPTQLQLYLPVIIITSECWCLPIFGMVHFFKIKFNTLFGIIISLEISRLVLQD